MDNSIQNNNQLAENNKPVTKRPRKTLADQDAEFAALQSLGISPEVLDKDQKQEMKKVFVKQLLAAAKRGNVLAIRMLGEISRVYSSKTLADPYDGMTLEDKKKRIQELLVKGERNQKLR